MCVFNAKVTTDREVASSAYNSGVLCIWNMELGVIIVVLACKAKVNNVDQSMFATLKTNDKVIRFDITMNIGMVVKVFKVRNLKNWDLAGTKW